MKKTLTLILILITNLTFGQFSVQKIITDSTEIELTRNSLYKIWEEKYKDKDSVFYCVWYMSDTTQINSIGWRTKDFHCFGKGAEYKSDGTWLYTIDYDSCIWHYNIKEYPYQYLLDSMKKIADQIIIDKYGQAFFKSNIKFNFYGHTSQGGWTAPIKERPNEYSLEYTIELKEHHFYEDYLLEIILDSVGKLVPNSNKSQLSFPDRVKGECDSFSLTYDKAIDICKQNGLIISDTIKYKTELKFINWKAEPYTGKFVFEVVQYLNYTVIEGTCPEKCKYEVIYRKWLIDPWTSKLLENNKYRSFGHWSYGTGGGGENIEIIE